jgi:hypothetical protein
MEANYKTTFSSPEIFKGHFRGAGSFQTVPFKKKISKGISMRRFIIMLAFVGTFSSGFSQIPAAISYQGIIKDPVTNENAADGPHSAKFAFYDAPTDGNLKWQTSSIPVTSFRGLFATIIPVPANATWDQPLYVELTVDDRVQTRTQLTTVPYAFRANSADRATTMNASGLTGTIPNDVLSLHLLDLADGTLSGSKVGEGISATNITTGTLAGNLVGPGINASNIVGSASQLINTVLDEDLQDLADGTLSGSKIGTGINASMIDNGVLPDNVLNEHLQDLADGTLSGSKIGAGIDAGALTTGSIGDQLLSEHLQDLADGVLTGSKVGAGIDAANVDTGTLPYAVLPGDLLTGSGTAGKFAVWSDTHELVAEGPSWDAVQDELGIGVADPTASLHLVHDNAHPVPTALRIDNNSDIDAPKTGIEINMTNNPGSAVTGVDIAITSSGTGNRTGFIAQISSSATNVNDIRGVDAQVSGTGTGAHYGIRGEAFSTSTGVNRGVYGNVTGTGTGDKYAVYGLAEGTGVTKYGVRGEVSGAGTSNIGVFGTANGATNNYGVYGASSVGPSSYAVYAAGNIYATGNIDNTSHVFGPSDRKLKRNISPMRPALHQIMKLNPSTYYFRKEEFPSMNFPEGLQYGLIAQEVEEIFPELVGQTVNPGPIDEQGKSTGESTAYKSLDYISLIPILIKGMQEQQAEILELESEVEKLLAKKEKSEKNSAQITARKTTANSVDSHSEKVSGN